MNRIVIELPIPHRILHKNGRTLRRGWLAAVTKAARERAYIEARAALGRRTAPKWKRANLSAQWYLTTARKRDDDGLTSWLVPYRDGLEDAGIVENDTGITVMPHTVAVDKSSPRVVLTIEATQ